MTSSAYDSPLSKATLAGLLATTQLVDPSAATEVAPSALRAAFDRALRAHGTAELAPRFGLSAEEFREDFVAVFRLAAETFDIDTEPSVADSRIAQLRFLSRLETIADRGVAVDIPAHAAQSTELMAQKEVRAVELVLRALINEKADGQAQLIEHLRRLFGTKLVDKWLKQANKGDILTGTLFSEVAQIFAHEAEFPNYAPIYDSDACLTFLQDKRETIKTFLEDIRFIRNRVYHHKALTSSQIDLLDAYHEQILVPVQALYDRRGTKVNPDAYFDVEKSAVVAYFGEIKEDLTSIHDKISEVSDNVVQIKSETEGLRERTQKTLGMVSLLRSRVGMALAGIVLLLVMAGATVAIVNDGKKEVSSDPRKELQNMGIRWDPYELCQAIVNKDHKSVELFLDGGMKIDVRMGWCDQGSYRFVEMFLNQVNSKGRNYNQKDTHFDNIIAKLIESHQESLDPVVECPTDGNGYAHDNRYHIYIGDKDSYGAKDDQNMTRFVRAICNKPAVIAKLDGTISGLINRGENDEAEKWSEVKRFLAGSY